MLCKLLIFITATDVFEITEIPLIFKCPRPIH